MLGRWAVGVVVLFTVLLLMLPSRDEQSLSRIGSASMLACTKDIRTKIEAQLRRKEIISVETKNPCPDLIASLSTSAQGEMTITGNKFPVTMHLTPVFEDSGLRWSCVGRPLKSVTNLCKP